MKSYIDRMRDKRGDIYFEFLICMLLFITLLSLSIQVITAVQLKFWLDRSTAAIIRHVQICGEVDESAETMISEIEDRLGDSITVKWDARFIPGTRKVQLGDQVRLSVSGETPLFKFGGTEVLKVEISSEMVGTCERYWKT